MEGVMFYQAVSLPRAHCSSETGCWTFAKSPKKDLQGHSVCVLKLCTFS